MKYNIKLSSKIVIAITMLLILLVISFKVYGEYKFDQYLNTKYGNAIVIDEVKYRNFRIYIFDKNFNANATYKDINFRVDWWGRNDNYVTEYTSNLYKSLILTKELSEYIDSLSFIIEDGVSKLDLGRTDFIFYLTIGFNENISTKEQFIYAIELVLNQFKEANLINCDTLESFATIDNVYMTSMLNPSSNININRLDIDNSIIRYDVKYRLED